MFENFIDGQWFAPAQYRYLVVSRYSRGRVGACRVPRSSAEDVERALDAAHRARNAWFHLESEERAVGLARIPHQVGDRGLSLALTDCRDRAVSAFAVDQRVADTVL